MTLIIALLVFFTLLCVIGYEQVDSIGSIGGLVILVSWTFVLTLFIITILALLDYTKIKTI